MDVQAYLARIGVSRIGGPGHAFLLSLQERHLLSIPFENLDVIFRRPILLDEDRLLEKIVRRQRGGFCYELNGAFAWLLKRLGFSVTLISAGVFDSQRDEYGPPYDHMALLVHLSSTYLVDVGFGDSSRRPILLPDGKAEDVSGCYRIQPDATGDRQFLLQRYQEERWQPQYRFTTEPQRLADYQDRCDYFQTDPHSHFRRGLLCTLATCRGRITLTDQRLTITNSGSKEHIQLNSPQEVNRMLHDHFGIESGTVVP